jgi:hypothetical protein
MSEPSLNKFQWKWVWISLVMYFLFYFLPLSLVPGGFLSVAVVTDASRIFVSIWSIAGIVIISAVTGFLSVGITLKEPTISAVGFVVLWIIALQLKVNNTLYFSIEISVVFLFAMVFIGVLALGGAWFGELVQRTWNKKQLH